jgi:hypothetical protein
MNGHAVLLIGKLELLSFTAMSATITLVEYKPDQNLTLSAKGMLILCKDADSEFNVWKDNSFTNRPSKNRR